MYNIMSAGMIYAAFVEESIVQASFRVFNKNNPGIKKEPQFQRIAVPFLFTACFVKDYDFNCFSLRRW